MLGIKIIILPCNCLIIWPTVYCFKAITPPDALQPMAGPGTLPTAAAVAAAAVTAKITAMDAQEQIKSLVRDLAPCQIKLKAV